MMVLPAPGSSAPRIVGQEEAQRLARQHRFVDGRYLVRQRLDHGRMDGRVRIEEVGEANALGLGDQPEQAPVAVEAPGSPVGDDLEARFVVAIEQFVGDLTVRFLVGQLDRFRAEPLQADDRHRAVGVHTSDGTVGSKVLELHARSGPPAGPHRRLRGRSRRPPAAQAMRTVRGNCWWFSRPVCLYSSSSAVGCTRPSASVARETSVCSPGVAPSQS